MPALSRFYTLLFVLSITLINPWGQSRGAIWTLPKVFILTLILFTNLVMLGITRRNQSPKTHDPDFKAHDPNFTQFWRRLLRRWILFLGLGLLTTGASTFPQRSFLGQDEMGDGWLYWFLLAGFVLTNTKLLHHQPHLFRVQANGILIGGLILALSMIPQVLDWQIDYTITTGQRLQDQVLLSSIFRNHQPIGLYSHRGHAALVLAMTQLLWLLAWRWGWFPRAVVLMALGFLSLGLWLSQTRSAIGALLVGMVGLGAGRRWLIGMVLVGLVAVGMISGDRHLANLSGLKQWTSDRIYLWQVALERIEQRPLLGWGYDGFGIAYGNGEDQNREIVSLEQFSFTYRDDQGELQVGILPSNKAHNLVLDSLLSVGILGTIAYGYLWSLSLGMGPNQLSFSQLKVMGWAYLAFTLLWFESAQYSHLAWWAMTGLWASKPMVKLKDGNSDD